MCKHFLDTQLQYKKFHKILFTTSPYTLVKPYSKLKHTQVQHGEEEGEASPPLSYIPKAYSKAKRHLILHCTTIKSPYQSPYP